LGLMSDKWAIVVSTSVQIFISALKDSGSKTILNFHRAVIIVTIIQLSCCSGGCVCLNPL
jgi:hypothetical protein